MSFILDALKKSELERQRQSVPGLMDATVAPKRKGFPIWAIALGALLGINLLVTTLVLTRKSVPASQVSRTADSRVANSRVANSRVADSRAVDSTAGDPVATDPALAADATARTEGTAARPAHFSPLDAAPVYAPENPVA